MRGLSARVFAVAALSVCVLACSLITTRDGLQCTDTAACRALGPEFAATRCSSAGLCETIVAPEAGISTGCALSADCAFILGEPGRCSSGVCRPIPHGICKSVGPISDDASVLFGVLLPESGEAAAQTAGLKTLIDALISDWNTSAQSAPKFAAAICDESRLTEAVAALQTLEPRFVLGPVSEKALQAVLAQTQFTVLSPTGDSPSYVSTPDAKQRQWFCNSNRAAADVAFGSLANKIAQQVATSRSLANVKVAFAYDSAEPNEGDFFNKVRAGLSFNGKLASAQPAYYVEQDVKLDLNDANATATAAAFQLAAAKPDVVLLSGAVWSRTFIDGLETRWAVLNGSYPRPVYVSMRLPPALAVYAQGDSKAPTWDNRAYALDVARAGAVATTYDWVRGQLAQRKISQEPYGATQFSDCAFAGFYGAVAASITSGVSATQVTPFQLAQGLKQVSQGTTEVKLVHDDINTMLGLLSVKASAVMIGGTTRLGFDPSTGVPASDLRVYCLGSKSGPNPRSWEFAGVTYDATNQSASGAISCP